MISNKYQFIFLHIPRTGGSSIESLFVNTEQVYTWDGFTGKHWTPRKYRRKYPRQWNNYFKFTFIRNPWDRMVSTWKWLCLNTAHPHHTTLPFHDFIMSITGKETQSSAFIPQCTWLHSDLSIICRYEHLEDDWINICNTLKLPDRYHQLPHFNNTNNDHHYTEYYDEETLNKINTLYKEDVTRLKYKYGD